MTDQIEEILSQTYPTGDPDIESAWRRGRRRRRVKRWGSVAGAVAVVAAGVVGFSTIHSGAGQNVSTSGQPASVPDSSLYAVGECGTVYKLSPGASALTPLATSDVLGKPGGPQAIVVDGKGSTAYVAGSNSVWPVNLLTGTAGNPIPFEGTIETLNLSADEATLYVGVATQHPNANSGSLIAVSLPSRRRDPPIDLPGIPIAMLTSPGSSTAYVDIAEVWQGTHPNSHLVTPGTVAVVDLRRRLVTKNMTGTGPERLLGGSVTVPGDGLDFVALSRDAKLAYAYTSYTGTDIETVDPATGRVLATIPIPQAGEFSVALNGFALSANGATLYLLAGSTRPNGQAAIFAIDLAFGTVRLFTYLPGYGADSLTLAPDGSTLWATQASSPGSVPEQLAATAIPAGTTSVIADSNGCVVTTINTPGQPSNSPIGIDTGRH